MPSTRKILLGLLAGVVHAAILLAVAMDLGYAVGPPEYGPLDAAWRYGGLVLVAALPAWLALEYRLLTPLFALLLTSGYVLGVELTPPGPSFHDVAEFEPSVDGPTGITVVENGLYIVRYMVNATVWTVGFLFLGLVEYAARTAWSWVPPVRDPTSWLTIPAGRRRAVAVAAVGGLVHAAVMVWFAHRLGLSGSGISLALLYLYGAVGMFVLAAVPLYLLVRHEFVAPALLLALFVLMDVRAEFASGPGEPHALYFGAWFVYLAIVLVAAIVEYLLREIDVFDRFAQGA